LFIMCGIAFSGKTTVAKELVQTIGCAYVSLDDINAERGPRGDEGGRRPHLDRMNNLREGMMANESHSRKSAYV
jgi:gluconate kinase